MLHKPLRSPRGTKGWCVLSGAVSTFQAKINLLCCPESHGMRRVCHHIFCVCVVGIKFEVNGQIRKWNFFLLRPGVREGMFNFRRQCGSGESSPVTFVWWRTGAVWVPDHSLLVTIVRSHQWGCLLSVIVIASGNLVVVMVIAMAQSKVFIKCCLGQIHSGDSE